MDKAVLIQQVWPEWRLGREIGEGSFGSVYEIERATGDGIVKSAVKFISIPKSEKEILEAKADGMDEKSATEYFKSIMEELVREFTTMEMLSGNRNVVMHEDHAVVQRESEIGWDILIKMELLTPFKEYMLEHELDEKAVIRLGIDMCKALVACEKYKVVHRDIKPENVFVSKDGDFKLGDFGVARTVEKTSSGMSIKGTISYMAPEVYRGMAYNATVDIYSLGIMLYRLVNNNRAPFLPPAPTPIKYKDKEVAEMRRISGEVLPDAACASPEVMRIIRKAAAYEPSERYAIAGEMLYDLAELYNALARKEEEERSALEKAAEETTAAGNENIRIYSLPKAFEKNNSESEQAAAVEAQMPMGQPGPMGQGMPMGQPGPMGQGMPMGQPGPMEQGMPMCQPGPMGPGMPMGQPGPMGQGMPMGQPGQQMPPGEYRYVVQPEPQRRRLKPIAIVGIVIGSILLTAILIALI